MSIIEDGPRPYRRVVVVHGYGCDVNWALRPYLDRVTTYILQNDVHQAVFCGGETQKKSFPGRTEARVMSAYVLAKLAKVARPFPLVVHHEEASYTTFRNVVGAGRILRHLRTTLWEGELPEPGEVTVFCEAQRIFKTILLYWLLLPEFRPKDGDEWPELRVRFETDSWERASPLTEILKLGNELLMYAWPWWERRMHHRREAASYAK